MTSKLTRERLEKIKSWRETYGAGSNVMLPAEEAEELACLALAAMDSEPVEMPLDYLQGHKDGLEWAARLAEANHPETGDWLYDDPIELAKAIRKGPDMPPVQPAADSEPVAWLLSGGGAKNVVCFDSGNAYADPLREVTPLYRHAQPVPVVSADLLHSAASAIEDLLTTKDRTGAGVWFDLPFRLRSAANAQPAPVVPDDVLAALQKVARIRLELNDFDGDRRGIADCLCDAEEALIEVVNRRAAMLHAGNSPAQSGCCPAQNSVVPAQSGSSPAIPDGYVLVPKEATKEILDEFDSIIDYGAEDSVDAWHRLLAAATQEVKP